MNGAGSKDFGSLWIYLSTQPLLWLTLTLVVWLIADKIARTCRRHPLANPVLISIVLLVVLLTASDTSYQTYFKGAQFIHFLLGPATVAIAVPLVRNFPLVRANLAPMAAALAAGSVTAIVSAVGLATILGAPRLVQISIAPKSATAAVAMPVSAGLGGDASLTAVLVIATGIIGAVVALPLMDRARIKDEAARGFAIGLTSHGIGAARAFAANEVTGAFAGIAMGLNGVATAVLAPILLGWMA